jgi:hypothetical protein
MSWYPRPEDTRRYPRKRRVKGRVVRETVGPGEKGYEAARTAWADRTLRECQRRQRQQDIEEIEDEIREFETDLLVLDELTHAIVRAVLNAAGYFQHDRGPWRKRREPKVKPGPITVHAECPPRRPAQNPGFRSRTTVAGARLDRVVASARSRRPIVSRTFECHARRFGRACFLTGRMPAQGAEHGTRKVSRGAAGSRGRRTERRDVQRPWPSRRFERYLLAIPPPGDA